MNKSARKISFVITGVVIGVSLLARSCTLRKNQTIAPSHASLSASSALDLPSSSPTRPEATDPDRESDAHGTAQTRQFMSAFQSPINFYGKVIDQDGNPVAAAEVKLVANDKPMGGRPSEFRSTTDGVGVFSLTNVSGLTLAVEVSKPGYRSIPPEYGKVTSSGVFDYGLSSSQTAPRPDRTKPIVFKLHKYRQKEPLIRIEQKHFKLARDGSPLSISLDPAHAGNHRVVLKYWNAGLVSSSQAQSYDWSFEIIVIEGGLIPQTDELDCQAPEAGFVATDEIRMPGHLPVNQWRSFAERSYFIRFNDGVFARADIRVRAAGDQFVVWQSYLNPQSGSRNLEYDPTQENKVK